MESRNNGGGRNNEQRRRAVFFIWSNFEFSKNSKFSIRFVYRLNGEFGNQIELCLGEVPAA